jgi:hypothetical protein
MRDLPSASRRQATQLTFRVNGPASFAAPALVERERLKSRRDVP